MVHEGFHVLRIGDTNSDLGATVTDNAGQNIGVYAFVGSVPLDQAIIDTSTTTAYHIVYVATDNAGNTATSTRTSHCRELGHPQIRLAVPSIQRHR
jgi:hypothetical protein